MVRLLIEDVTIRKGEHVQLDVRFRGGMSKTLMLPLPLSYCESHKQNPAMVAEMDRLLDDYNYADVARILNEKGFETGDGLPLTSPAVGYIRTAYRLESRFDRLRKRGMLTIFEIARRCGVSTNTISDWRRKSRIRGHVFSMRMVARFRTPDMGGRKPVRFLGFRARLRPRNASPIPCRGTWCESRSSPRKAFRGLAIDAAN